MNIRRCAECGADDSGAGLFPFYRLGKEMFVCFECLRSHRGYLRHICPVCVKA
jgi:hypothetical protein